MGYFTIINLADLHIDGNRKDEQRKILMDFTRDFNRWIEKEEMLEWHPDFITIAGDVINQGEMDFFGDAEEILREFANELSVPYSSIIMAPGNHDKKSAYAEGDTPEIVEQNKQQYKKIKENFESFCDINHKKLTGKAKNIHTEFFKIQGEGFGQYNNFYKELSFQSNEDSYTYIPYTHFQDTPLEYVTGIKIFPDKKVCFLTLNSEWIYAEDKVSDLIPRKNIAHYVGRNIVGKLYVDLMEEYADYTIITLMHRNPNESSFSEFHHTNLFKKYALGYIEHCSDIIITGHDHSLKTTLPDRIKNLIQHVRLGTSSLKLVGDGAHYPYSICILKINLITEDMELLRATYEIPTAEQQGGWSFEVVSQKFPLRNKYEKRGWNKQYEKLVTSTVIKLKVRSDNKNDIPAAIRNYFRYDKNDKEINSIIVDLEECDGKLKNDLADKLVCGSLNHIVFYFKNYYQDEKCREEIKKYNEISDAFKLKILLGEVVFSFIVLEFPVKKIEFDSTEKDVFLANF